jgi:hypothetical protein
MSYRLDKTDENDKVKERKVDNEKSSISEWSPVDISISFSGVSVDGSSDDTFVMLFS